MAPDYTVTNWSDNGDYLPDNDLAAAAQVAMILGRPLLLTGEPGTGKTTFGQHVARVLGPQHFHKCQDGPMPEFPLYTFDTKSTSVATDLFYRFDSLRRFHAAHDPQMSQDARDYLTFEALGQAILETQPPSNVEHLLRNAVVHPGPRRSVVLIDEIDKAPRDFPNDLLNEIDRMFFRVPELPPPLGQGAVTVTAKSGYWPIVILTSNSEKNLPAPFLRRCVFHHIRFPERDESARLLDIVKSNLGGTSELASSAIDFFYDIRSDLRLEKLPTTQELVQWIRILQTCATPDSGVSGKVALQDLPTHRVRQTLGVLGKTTNDLHLIGELLAAKRSSRKAVQ